MQFFSVKREVLYDPKGVAERRAALQELGAEPGTGGQTGLIAEKTVARLLGITEHAVTTVCPVALKLRQIPAHVHVVPGQTHDCEEVRLYDPTDVLPLKNDPRVEAARRRRAGRKNRLRARV